jgi:hypothetical protein
MKGFVLTAAALLALTIPAAAGAAGHPNWVRNPTCTATMTDLTCTGKAAGVQPPFIDGYGPVEAAIIALNRWHCPLDPETGLGGYDQLFSADGRTQYVATTPFHNGTTFSMHFSGHNGPAWIYEWFSCNNPVGWQWADDPNYYNVSVVVGWAFGGASITALEAPIGTVSPG